jgi:hypothetical protein
MNNQYCNSEKVSRTATIITNGNIQKVFPLFGAFKERKWAEGWNPKLIYPLKEIIEEGTTFRTEGHGKEEKEYLWRVSRFEPEKYLIQYLVSTENRYWTITIKCKSVSDIQTKATITYTFIGLNKLGNNINSQSLQEMYANNLIDWQEAINYYLDKGQILKGK